MNQETKLAVLALERKAHALPLATAINQLCVQVVRLAGQVAELETELAKRRKAETCSCPASDPEYNPHTEGEHTDCGGYSASGPPCGGCDSCISAQVARTTAAS